MNIIFQGEEMELEAATDDEMSLDYLTEVEVNNYDVDLDNTIEITKEEVESIINVESGDSNE